VACDLVALSQDMNKNVRVSAIQQMAEIGKLLKIEHVVTKFYPELKKLCTDRWEIKLAIAENIDKFSLLMPEETRSQNLGDFMKKFIDEDNRWVKETAYLKLGHFLATLTKDNMNDKLLGDYLK